MVPSTQILCHARKVLSEHRQLGNHYVFWDLENGELKRSQKKKKKKKKIPNGFAFFRTEQRTRENKRRAPRTDIRYRQSSPLEQMLGRLFIHLGNVHRAEPTARCATEDARAVDACHMDSNVATCESEEGRKRTQWVHH